MSGANLGDIVVFMAVADGGSFVAGGRATGLTRSAAGKAVSRLEDRLGVRLLQRTTRALSLTDEGRAFYERGQAVLAAVDDAEASVAPGKGTPRGLLRLTVPNGFGRLAILPLIATYLARWPDVQVEASFADRPADIVEEGFDLAVRIGNVDADSRLVARVVARYPVTLVAAPAYVEQRGEPTDLAALSAHDRLVFSSRGRRQAWRFPDGRGGEVAVQGRPRVLMDSGEALRDAAIAGLGIALLPAFLVGGDLAAGRLCPILPESDLGTIEVFALYPSRRLLEPRVRRFIDLLAHELGR